MAEFPVWYASDNSQWYNGSARCMRMWRDIVTSGVGLEAAIRCRTDEGRLRAVSLKKPELVVMPLDTEMV